jgi:hypothetical protein
VSEAAGNVFLFNRLYFSQPGLLYELLFFLLSLLLLFFSFDGTIFKHFGVDTIQIRVGMQCVKFSE